MTEITSTFAANVGALVINLAKRGYLVRLGIETSVLSGDVLRLTIADMRDNKHATVSESMSEQVVSGINDVNVIVDALINKLNGSRK